MPLEAMTHKTLPPIPVIVTTAIMDEASFVRLVKCLELAGLEMGVPLSTIGIVTGSCCPDRVEGLKVLPGVIDVDTDKPCIAFEGTSPPG
jgi:hypothetical protein